MSFDENEKRYVIFYKNAYVDIIDKKTSRLRTCHLKEIKNVCIDKLNSTAEIDGFEVSYIDGVEMRMVMLGIKSFKDLIQKDEKCEGTWGVPSLT